MPSPRFIWQLRKETRELRASKAFVLLLIAVSLLVGQAFTTAVGLYAEASRGAIGAPDLAAGLSPFEGIVVPTFGAYDLAATLLLPFVAIRLLAAERQNGGWTLMLQAPVHRLAQVLAKALVLLVGWTLAFLPGLMALALWWHYGGHLHGPEVLNLLLGHLLRGFLAITVALLAAALADNASSAAIGALGFTLGTWAVDFMAAGRDGWLRKLAAFTPAAALRGFEQGLLALGPLVVLLAFAFGCLLLVAIALHPGRALARRVAQGAGVLGLLAIFIWGASLLHGAWDLSEGRRNSFAPAMEIALKQIHQPLHVQVFLAPEDPRFMDLERSLLAKLQRSVPIMDVQMMARTRSGCFEGSDDHYGEVWYQVGGRKDMSRSTSEEEVLPLVLALTGRSAPEATAVTQPTGHPLVAQPRYASLVFFALWPLMALALHPWPRLFRRKS